MFDDENFDNLVKDIYGQIAEEDNNFKVYTLTDSHHLQALRLVSFHILFSTKDKSSGAWYDMVDYKYLWVLRSNDLVERRVNKYGEVLPSIEPPYVKTSPNYKVDYICPSEPKYNEPFGQKRYYIAITSQKVSLYAVENVYLLAKRLNNSLARKPFYVFSEFLDFFSENPILLGEVELQAGQILEFNERLVLGVTGATPIGLFYSYLEVDKPMIPSYFDLLTGHTLSHGVLYLKSGTEDRNYALNNMRKQIKERVNLRFITSFPNYIGALVEKHMA